MSIENPSGTPSQEQGEAPLDAIEFTPVDGAEPSAGDAAATEAARMRIEAEESARAERIEGVKQELLKQDAEEQAQKSAKSAPPSQPSPSQPPPATKKGFWDGVKRLFGR